jgi:molecular chaperone DnaK (HSP70)
MPYDKGFAQHICSQLTSYTDECVKYLTTQTPKTDEEFLSKMEQITQQCKPCKEAKERIKAKREELRKKEDEAKRASATAKNVGLILLGIGAIAFTSYLIYKLLKR